MLSEGISSILSNCILFETMLSEGISSILSYCILFEATNIFEESSNGLVSVVSKEAFMLFEAMSEDTSEESSSRKLSEDMSTLSGGEV
ncbi:hypothetical protein TNCV_2346041 [Trichonephila clavipes]|nr:hypothetical protein TNCV_2346041 [Trichonephila clavipes]